MKIQRLNSGVSRLVIVSALTGLALSGCNQPPNAAAPQDAAQAPPPIAALALSTSAAPPLAPAPAVNALPQAPRPRWARLANPNDSYAYADRAYGLNQAFADSPPDYTFDYDGVRPWVWRSDSDDVRVVEPLQGGDRYYYYQPGADAPYLVRDPDYSYAYQDGALVAVYDRSGRRLDDAPAEQRLDLAGRYLARARAIYAASRQQQHQAVAQANWVARRQAIQDDRAHWAQDEQNQADWRAYHTQHDSDQHAQWDAERYRREAEAARFALAINDAAAAQHDLQAAREAQARSASQSGGGGRPGPAAPPASQQQVQPPSGPYGQQRQQSTPPQPREQPAARGDHGVAPAQTPPEPAPRDTRVAPQSAAAIAQKQGQDQVVREAQARNLAEQKAQAADAPRLQAAQQAQAARQAQALAAQQQARARMTADVNARDAAASAKAAAEHARQAQAQSRAQAQAADRARLQQQAQAHLASEAQVRAAAAEARAKAAPPAPATQHPPVKPKPKPNAPGQEPPR